jgi:hypothetical protein
MKHTKALWEIPGVFQGHGTEINNDTWQAVGFSGQGVS